MAARLLLVALFASCCEPSRAWAPGPLASSAVSPPRARAVLLADASSRTFEVCRGKHCSKRGSKTTLELMQQLATPGAEVVVADCSDTEHGCFDECTMGPNVRVGARIVNGVKGAAACAELLGVDAPPG